MNLQGNESSGCVRAPRRPIATSPALPRVQRNSARSPPREQPGVQRDVLSRQEVGPGLHRQDHRTLPLTHEGTKAGLLTRAKTARPRRGQAPFHKTQVRNFTTRIRPAPRSPEGRLRHLQNDAPHQTVHRPRSQDRPDPRPSLSKMQHGDRTAERVRIQPASRDYLPAAGDIGAGGTAGGASEWRWSGPSFPCTRE